MCNIEMLGLITVTAFLLPATDGSYFTDVRTRSIQENWDDQHGIWYITAYCYVRYTYSYTCYASTSYDCGYSSPCVYYYSYTCSAKAYMIVECNRCYISSDPSGNFNTDGGRWVLKKYCSQHTCSDDCPNYDGCLRGGDTHDVGVVCYSDQYETPGTVETSFSVVVTSANGPSFYYDTGSSISPSHDTVGIGSVISTIVYSLEDDGYDYDYVRFQQRQGPANSYILQTPDLFYLDTGSGQVKVGKDLTKEFSYFYTMNLCVIDRRGRDSCNILNITLWACFQTPNCTSQQEWSLHDVYGKYTGHGGSSNLIFSQQYPQPDEHFPYFSTVWHQLTWTFDFNEFQDFSAINQDTGDIFVTRNISIWPAWPTKDFSARVRVANTESCYPTSCDFFIRVHYTNWPIEIRSLPNVPQYEQFEDDDNGYKLHDLVVYDYNYDYEDNMTCYIHRIQPHEDNLFYLQHDGRYKYNSYTLYKLICQNPDCGYKHPLPSEFTHSSWQPFYCDTDIGCLTYNRTQQYTVTIKCDDAYNTTDEKDFTFNVYKNQVPKYRTLPILVDLDRNKVSKFDNIFEIMYWDFEKENLYYEYTYTDVDTGLDPGYFTGTTWGNFYDTLGNITMTTHLWDKDVNKTYKIHICGHERRNEICEDLTVDIEEYCSESPQCSNPATVTFDTTSEVGTELLDLSTSLKAPTSGVPFSDLSYSIKSSYGNLFDIDSTTGKITLKASFPEVYPFALYSIVGFVYNSGACDKGTCQLTINVTYVNHPIEITNVPTTKTVHEDTSSGLTLLTVFTSDQNEDDPYTCNITSSNSVEPFYLEREPPKSGYYYLKKRANYQLSATPFQYDVQITCYDSHGSSDSYTLPIYIEPNKAPVFDSTTFSTVGLSLNARIEDYRKGDMIRIVSASDIEGDNITWICTIDNNFNPLTCKYYSTYLKVYLRRSLSNDHDEGKTYSVNVCIGDAKHTKSSCGDIHITFTQSRTEPSISNMNVWPLYFAEDTAIGQVLFTPTIVNPDLGETVTVFMKVYPTKYSANFRFDKDTKQLLLKKGLDYETAKKFRFEFAVKDDYLMGLENYTGFMYVTNVNEGNTLSINNTEMTFPEDTTVGTVLPNLGLTCADIDGDTVTLSIQSGYNSDFFSINAVTGQLALAKLWDLETSIRESTILTIQCSDPGGLASTAEVEITVTDVNEFAPLCQIIYKFSDPLKISPSTPLSTILATIQCSDPDRDDNGVFYSHSLGGGIAGKYFRAVQRRNRKRTTGSVFTDIKLLKPIDFSNDKSFDISFEISDGEGNPLLSGISISVNFTKNDPDEKTKQAKKCVTCTTNGKVIIAVLAVELAIICLFVIHACQAMMCHKNKVIRQEDRQRDEHSNIRQMSVKRASKSFDKLTVLSKPVQLPSGLPTSRSEQRKPSVSSNSSSSSDSDDEPRWADHDHGKFSTRVSLPGALSGLPSPIYTSGPGLVRAKLSILSQGLSGPGIHKQTGLPPPVYAPRTNSQATSRPISVGNIDLWRKK